MKKIILVVLVLSLSAFVFARGGYGKGQGDGQGRKRGYNSEKRENGEGYKGRFHEKYDKLTEEQKKKLEETKAKFRKNNQELHLEIEGIEVKIKKEMIKDDVNWNEVERLIKQKSSFLEKIELSRLKMKKEIEKIVGTDFFGNGFMGKGKRGMGNKRGGFKKGRGHHMY